ncbi:hypothetical protein P9D80_03290 [Bacillus spizizenii]|nr:hypothetical protein [Bacillus spizizenii]MEC1584388.1 hypothetical protein [Bacillus spizizenii]
MKLFTRQYRAKSSSQERGTVEIRYGFIYITVNKKSNKRYVGKCVYGRINSWENYLGSGVYLKRAIRKHGRDNFFRIIIDEADSEEELREIEEYYLEMFDAVNSNDFYNLKDTSIGGDTFTHHPEKERIRKLKSYNASGSRNPMYGVPKTKTNIEATRKANSKPVEIDGKIYRSSTEYGRLFGIGVTTVIYRINSPNYPNYKRIV